VLHLAAEMDFFPKLKQKVYNVNIEGTRNILEACGETGKIKRFVYCSTTETIGKVLGKENADEREEFNPTSDYGKSKIEAEKVVQQLGLKFGIPYVILRPTGIYGPKDKFAVFEAIQMVNQGLLFFIPGSGNSYVSFTYIDDVVDAFIKTLDLQNEKINNQIYNIASNDRMTYKEWFNLVARLTGRAKPVIHLPLSLVKPVIGLLSPIMNLGKPRTFMYETETVNRMTESRMYSSEKAKRDMNWIPKHNNETGLQKTIQYAYSVGDLYQSYFSAFAMIVQILTLIILYCLFL